MGSRSGEETLGDKVTKQQKRKTKLNNSTWI
jgi:hypothetical protein